MIGIQMSARVGIAILVTYAWGCLAGRAAEPQSISMAVTQAALLQRATADLIRVFWVTAPDGGHFRGACPDRRLSAIGCLWEQGQAYHALHGAWRVSPDPDLRDRLVANWRWIAAHHPLEDWATCGNGTAANYASDDTAWDVGTALDAHDVLPEPAILEAAKAGLDCAWRRWHSTDYGGGYWYSDNHKGKSLYQAILVLDCLRYFKASGDRVYLARAMADEAWIATHLMITPGTNSLPVGNGLYWCDYTTDGRQGGPGPAGFPFHAGEVRLAASVTFLGGNMAEAVVDADLFAITGEAVYRDRAVATAAAIRIVEVTPSGILLNDRDAWVDGWAAADFVTEVMPLLEPAERRGWQDTFTRTAASIATVDRTPDGRYGSDWQGPIDGVWTQHGSTPDQVMVNAQAIDIIAAAAAFRD